MTRTYHPGRRSRRARVIVGLAVLAAVYGFRRWRPFRVEIRGSSMRPALAPGDRAIAFVPGRIRRGDVVVLEHPTRPGFELVKRVTAVHPATAPTAHSLREGQIWVEGDAVEASTDSRTFGPVPASLVRGRLGLVYWPPRRWSAPTGLSRAGSARRR